MFSLFLLTHTKLVSADDEYVYLPETDGVPIDSPIDAQSAKGPSFITCLL